MHAAQRFLPLRRRYSRSPGSAAWAITPEAGRHPWGTAAAKMQALREKPEIRLPVELSAALICRIFLMQEVRSASRK
jgi:hypothetical protein